MLVIAFLVSKKGLTIRLKLGESSLQKNRASAQFAVAEWCARIELEADGRATSDGNCSRL